MFLCCAGPKSSVGLYPTDPNSPKLKKGENTFSKEVDYYLDDVRSAFKQAINMEGVFFDVEDPFFMSGVAQWAPPLHQCNTPTVSYAVYLSKGRNDSSTNFVFVVHHRGSRCTLARSDKAFSKKILSNLFTILATYD